MTTRSTPARLLYAADIGRMIRISAENGSELTARIVKIEFHDFGLTGKLSVYLFLQGDGWTVGISPKPDDIVIVIGD